VNGMNLARDTCTPSIGLAAWLAKLYLARPPTAGFNLNEMAHV